ncbi:MAG: cell division protein ZipA C-terminal FtsZ-binding domain-containing protein [bacterium]
MSSLFFYVILLFVFAAISWLFLYQRKQAKKRPVNIKREPIVDFNAPCSIIASEAVQQTPAIADKQPAYNSDIVVLQIQSFPGKPYMGYELLQTLLSVGLDFGDMSIFHRHEGKGGKGNVLFSVAAATPDGSFAIDDMGSFKCAGLVMFMKLDAKQKLMMRFDLMLDVARQLTEELGGDIYDDLYQPISAAVIRRLREKICTVETSSLYVADLLDNLD